MSKHENWDCEELTLNTIYKNKWDLEYICLTILKNIKTINLIKPDENNLKFISKLSLEKIENLKIETSQRLQNDKMILICLSFLLPRF